MSPRQNIHVEQASDEDVTALFRVMSQGFGHTAPFLDAYFPYHDTEQGRIQGTKRLLTWKQKQPESTFLKAVTSDETIIGVAVWTYMTEPPSRELDIYEDMPSTWPDEEDAEYMRRLWRDYAVPRGRVVTESEGKGIYVLELLAVRTDYQRRGAGKALVQWGTQAADERGIVSIVEGTPAARKLYESCGLLVEIEEMDFDVGERFKDRKKPILHFLKRSARST